MAYWAQTLFRKEIMAINRPAGYKKTKPNKANIKNIQTNQKSAKRGYQELFEFRATVKIESLDGFDILMENRLRLYRRDENEEIWDFSWIGMYFRRDHCGFWCGRIGRA